MTQCPNCHQPVKPSDDICENCGAVLTPMSAPARSVPPISAGLQPTAMIVPGVCPNCKQPVKPGDDICENCGAVLTPTPTPVTGAARVSNQASVQPSGTAAQAAALTTCPNCGAPRQSSARFCTRCGFSYTSIVSAQRNAPDQEQVITTRLAPGTVLNNKYKVVKAIGSGGMGAVYLADDIVLKRQVVIKVLLSTDDPELAAQSVKEREFLASIKHANIVAIYDFFSVGTEGYIVMEYVQGKTLHQLMEDNGDPLPVADAISYILGILPAFTYLAKLELVYCDFKPQNVILERLRDGTQIVKLIDLGTVIKYTPNPDSVYGTGGFFAPEAAQHPSPETDLYSICRTLAFLVSAMDLDSPIFGMPSAEHYKAFRDYPVLYRLLVKGTHPNPQRRFSSAEELGDQLAGVLRLIAGGNAGVPVTSRLFVTGALTTTGRLGLRGEAGLDERDKALDLLRQGDQALRGGNASSAQEAYRMVISVNPSSVDGHLRLAEVLIDANDFPQALAELTKAQRLAPSNWKIAWYTGRLLEAQGDLKAAAEQYSTLLDDLPGELPPQQALARVRARQGDDATAVGLYQQVLKADPSNTEAILGTNSLISLGRWAEAAKVLGGVSEATAKYVDAQLLLVDLFLYRISPITPQNVERAAQAIAALSGRTEDPRYYLARGDVYRAAWQLAQAKQLPADVTIAGLPDSRPRTLGLAAEQSYIQYLRREQHPPDREQVLRRKFEVAPWRLW